MSELKRSADWSPAKQEQRRQFSEDFKRDAMRLVIEEKYTLAAAAKAGAGTAAAVKRPRIARSSGRSARCDGIGGSGAWAWARTFWRNMS